MTARKERCSHTMLFFYFNCSLSKKPINHLPFKVIMQAPTFLVATIFEKTAFYLDLRALIKIRLLQNSLNIEGDWNFPVNIAIMKNAVYFHSKGGLHVKQNIYDNRQFFEGYQKIRERTYNYNNLIEQPCIRTLLPELTGKRILDVGCGAGDFAAFCADMGASNVDGIDISTNMIQLAKETHGQKGINFQQTAIEDMNLQSGAYDLVVSSLALHYVEDFTGAIQKIADCLAEDGQLIFSMQHPIYTANMGPENWLEDDNGHLNGFRVWRYFEKGERKEDWLVEGVIMYHQTISDVLNTLLRAGLVIEEVAEPAPDEEKIALLPGIAKVAQSPSFFVVKARKK